MADLFRELLNLYGPAFGPATFVAALIVTLVYHKTMREFELRLFRLGILLVDRDMLSFDDLLKFGVVSNNAHEMTLGGKL